MITNRILSTVAVGLAALVSGCGGPTYGEVEGVVTLNGKPLDKVEVVFLPDPMSGTGGDRASGYTEAQGRYTLRTGRVGKPGAVVGTHRVIIRDITARSGPPGRDGPEGGTRSKPSRTAEQYSDPAVTPFRGVEVKPGKQTHNFDVGTGSRS